MIVAINKNRSKPKFCMLFYALSEVKGMNVTMDKKDIQALRELMKKLYGIITINGKVNDFTVTAYNNQYAIPTLKMIIEELNSSGEDKIILLSDIRSQYNSMFPPKSGLNEFYVWSEDFDTRKEINDNFIKLHKEITSILNKD